MKIPALSYWRGYIEVTIRQGHVESFINSLTDIGIPVWDVKPTSFQTVEMKLLVEDFYEVLPILKRTGCRIHVNRRIGFPFQMIRLKKRRFFALGFMFFFAMLLLFSSLVWEVKVIGNVKIAKEDVLMIAKQEGIYPLQWVYRMKHLDKLSQQLNRQLPGTAWVGVNRQGTTITIEVVESSIPDTGPLLSPRHLISTKDAIITSIYSEQGRPTVSKNSRVKKGQILISGFLGDAENSESVVAKGEVKGLVWHEYKIEVPIVKRHKIYTGEIKNRSYLVLGDRGIQLWGYGKILFENHDVVTEHDPLTWRSTKLPIGWMTEHVMEVEVRNEVITIEEAKKQGIDGAIRDIMAKYGSGTQIISRKVLHENKENGKVYMKVLFEVEEFITEELPIVYSQGE
ncbi:sporulation protein YqfD [Paenibacillus sp. CMAA1364]